MSRCPHPGKIPWRSKREAKRALSRITKLQNRDALHAYRCECGAFHLGHKPGSRKTRDPQPRPA